MEHNNIDIEKTNKLISSQIEAGSRLKLRTVRNVLKTDRIMEQDAYDATAELLKPPIDFQKEVKKSINEKQDKLVEQLQKKQKAITLGLLDKIPEPEQLAIGSKQPLTSNLDKGFNKDETETLIKQGFAPPSRTDHGGTY